MNALNIISLWGKLGFALVIGAVGGTVFWAMSLPLPWMLGAITATVLGALSGLPISAPSWVRPPLSAIIGTMLGAGFPSDVLLNAGDWLLPLAGLFTYMVVAGAACVLYFHRICGYEFKTAFFCGMPGGLVEMTLLGESLGADGRRIALIHTARILMVVFIVSGGSRLFFLGSDPGGANPAAEIFRLSDMSPQTIVWIAGTCMVGVALGALLRLPAAFLLGPMLLSASMHVMSVTDFDIPRELVSGAQVGLGTTIGCRFLGQTFRSVGFTLMLCLGSTAILLSLTVIFAWVVHLLSGLNLLLLMLAYSPGGLAEMGLIALFLHLDTAFVACHHLFRVVLVGVSAGYIFKWFKRGSLGNKI